MGESPILSRCHHPLEEFYGCSNCGLKSHLKVEVKAHICGYLTENEEISFICQKCDLLLFSYMGHFLHQMRCKWKPKLKCEFCTFKTRQNGNLRRHNLVRHLPIDKIKWFDCCQCGFSFKSNEILKRHVLAKHTPTDEIIWFQCDQCALRFKTSHAHKQHILWKHTGRINWIGCDQCGREFKSKAALQRHILCKHTPYDEIIWFECEQCDAKYKTKDTLKRHILKKHIRQISFVKCPECDVTLTAVALRNHIRSKHMPYDEINWFKCVQCDAKYKFESYLKSHILSKHSTEWFECAHCEYRTTVKRYLHAHMKKHSNDFRWFYCDQCLYKSKLMSRLKNHFIVKHTPKEDIDWVPCPLCDYKAKVPQQLMRHKAKHIVKINHSY